MGTSRIEACLNRLLVDAEAYGRAQTREEIVTARSNVDYEKKNLLALLRAPSLETRDAANERLIFESFAYTGTISEGFIRERRDTALEILRALGVPARAELVDGDPDAPPERVGRHEFQPRFANDARWRLRIYAALETREATADQCALGTNCEWYKAASGLSADLSRFGDAIENAIELLETDEIGLAEQPHESLVEAIERVLETLKATRRSGPSSPPVAWIVRANGEDICYLDEHEADSRATMLYDDGFDPETIPLYDRPASPSIPREQQSGSLVLAAAEWLIGAEGRARQLGYTSAVDLSDALKATQQSEPSDTARLDWLALGYDVYVFGGKSWDIVDDRQDVYVEVVRSAPSLRAAIDAAMAASAFAPQEGSDNG